tara:strand:- start:5270 stop:6109 length:840 start_codon:yes stop_codon:yes gene_type:complete
MNINNQITVGNDQPLVVIGGMNVLESKELALQVCGEFCRITERLDMPYIFKASFDKANRSSIDSYRGPGLEVGLRILEEIKLTFDVPVITDVHELSQVNAVADVVDILQVPAFLARQTDLIVEMARAMKPINVKKPQFISPDQASHIVDKIRHSGNDSVMLCERGTNFGYDNLVVDMLGIGRMKRQLSNVPVILDITHSLQQRDSLASVSGGRRKQFMDLALSGVAVGLAGVFIESHPYPERALCDGPSALPLDLVAPVLEQLNILDRCVKSLPSLTID